jgi:hypothetical protein
MTLMFVLIVVTTIPFKPTQIPELRFRCRLDEGTPEVEVALA